MSVINKTKLLFEKKYVAFLWGALIGIIIFLLQYGVDVLCFTNVTWLTHSNDLEGLWDLTQHYYGWVVYRNSPWTFPIGLLEGIAVNPISVAYTDSIPLFAIIFKMLSPILPANFQYFGLFEIMCYALMGGFGSLITHKFTKSIINNSVSAVLFVISPVLLKRTFYHSALSAHFLILIAICLWIYRDEMADITHVILWSVLSMLCTLINPYYVPMVMGIMFCSLLQSLIVKKRWIYTLVCALVPGVCALAIGWPLGLFYGEVSSGGEGLEMVSFNADQLFNPNNPLLRHSDYWFDYVSYSKFLPNLPLHTDWQMEGFSYLGLGMLILIVLVGILWIISLVKGRDKFKDKGYRKGYISYIITIAICMVVFTLLAMGPDGSLGTHVLYSIKWPKFIYNMFAIFRTCGRFIWPVYYMLMSLALIGTTVLIDKKRLVSIILIVITIIQIVDLWPSFVYKRDVYKKASADYDADYTNPLYQSDVWKDLAGQIDEIIFVPPTDKSICFRAEKSCLFEGYAIDNDIKMSASYCSRDVSAMADEYAKENFAKRRNGETFPNAIYVMLYDNMFNAVREAGLPIYRYGDFYIASDRDLSKYSDLELVK